MWLKLDVLHIRNQKFTVSATDLCCFQQHYRTNLKDRSVVEYQADDGTEGHIFYRCHAEFSIRGFHGGDVGQHLNF